MSDQNAIENTVKSITNPPAAPAKEVWKPDISLLVDAIVDGKLTVPVGKDVVVQYPEPWRETVHCKIMHIYDESSPLETVECEVLENNEYVKKKFTCVQGTTVRPGHVRMLDLDRNHFCATNYLDAPKQGIIIKVWPEKKKK